MKNPTFCLVLYYLIQYVTALSCSCGITPEIRTVTNSLTGNPATSVCFQQNNDPTPYCSQTRVRIDNVASIANLCFNTLVGSRSLTCTGWFLFPDQDGITYDIYLCNMFNAMGNQVVSFDQCQPNQKPAGTVYDMLPVQPDPFDPLWSSASRCRESNCPEAETEPDPSNPFLTNRTGISYSVCNQALVQLNTCNSQTGTCTCQVFNDNTQAYTGQACQFEKGQGFCCAYPQNQVQIGCCANPSLVEPGLCLTEPQYTMCGAISQSRSARCISPDGISPPTCQRLVYDPTDMDYVLEPNCANGYTCPASPLLPEFNPTSPCLANIHSSNCSCQCSLCSFTCNGGLPQTPTGQSGYRPPKAPACECFVPPFSCVSPPQNPTQCTASRTCQADDLCGGAFCALNMNRCHTPTACDNSKPWLLDVPHPCVCSGNGLCNNVTLSCDCFNVRGNLNPNDGPPLFNPDAQCSIIESCIHCNSNSDIVPVASTCQSDPAV